MFALRAFASTASYPNVRDDRETPLVRDRMAKDMPVICVRRKPNYFGKGGWTGGISLKALGKIVPTRSANVERLGLTLFVH